MLAPVVSTETSTNPAFRKGCSLGHCFVCVLWIPASVQDPLAQRGFSRVERQNVSRAFG
jgi:hypothetical protein